LPELPELPELPNARKPLPVAQPVQVQAVQRPAQEVTAAPPPPTAAQARVPAPAAAAPFELVEGALVAERYLLEQKLGEGGTAVVFRAADLELEEEVAIKIFSNTLDDPDMVRRFKQELSVTRRLSHPNVVRLHDIGMDRGHRFLTMEVLKGHDLATRLASGPMPLPEALDLLLQATSGLALAHSHGVIHRDIKPENFFITVQGVLKVMDFGLAKKATAQKRTQAGFIAGTPPYMSPEQINGFADVTALADIYSLGIVAYEMCAGVLPFQHEELMPLLVMHMTETPASPIGYNADIPRELAVLILKLLEKEPRNRVQSMNELGEQLARLRKLVT
jgi:eukaryotic-like serine/threonine-protein kinase